MAAKTLKTPFKTGTDDQKDRPGSTHTKTANGRMNLPRTTKASGAADEELDPVQDQEVGGRDRTPPLTVSGSEHPWDQ